MRLIVNGEERELSGNFSVAGLLEHCGVKAPRVAVELNFTIVPRSEYPTTSLREGDEIEIVSFVGGG